MMRLLKLVKPDLTHQCCPGHDVFPNETYNSRRSKKARARDKRLEHRYVRHLLKHQLKEYLNG